MLLKQTIHLFLDSVGRSEEYEYYLGKFRSESHPVFSVLCPDLDSFRRVHRGILFDIQFLQKLDLFPAVILSGPFAEEMAAYCREAEGIQLFHFGKDASLAEIRDALVSAKENHLTSFIVAKDRMLSEFLSFILPEMSGRVHFIRMAGSIRDANLNSINFYRLKKEGASVLKEDLPVLNTAAELIQKNPDLHVSVTSPLNLLKEIFTVKGAGTIIRRGCLVEYKNSLSDSDAKKMIHLLEKSFQKKLKNSAFLHAKNHFFIEENFTAAGILEKTAFGMYLTKFAVDTNARGSGVAQEIWDSMYAKEKSIFWRARKNNAVNRWYASLSDGMQKTGEWIVYWRGVNASDIPGIIEFCSERGEDFY